MIEINLLPEELRKKKKGRAFSLNLEDDKLKLRIGAALLAALVFIVIVLALGSFVRKAQIGRLITREKGFSDRLARIDGINNEIIALKSKMAVLDQLTKRKFVWAEKLNQLSDLLLPGIWFSRVYTDSENRLIIEGSVISKSEEAMAFVGKFMKNIRDNQKFFADFKNIKLESVQRSNKGEADIVDYKIALYFY